MAETIQLNFSWLGDLTNPNHDSTTQQIDDFVSAFQTENARYLAKAAAVHQARLREDDVWLTSQRDPAAKQLEAADKLQDSYIAAARYIITAHAGLPESESTKAEAMECAQVFKDYKFRTDNSYSAESDKIIQMQQNFQQHEAFLTQIGAWTFFTKAVTSAQLVRQLLGQRALTMGQFVKSEMKKARTATDQAIADLYKTIEAMDELMPSAELTALITQLKGLELYARQYILNGANGQNGANGANEPNGSNEQDGQNGSNGQNEPNGSNENGGSGDSGNSGDAGGSGESGGSSDQGGDNGGGDNGGGGGQTSDGSDQ